MKKLITIILASIVMMPVVMAEEEAPPSLTLNFNGNTATETQDEEAPPSLNLNIDDSTEEGTNTSNDDESQAVPSGGNNDDDDNSGQVQDIEIVSHSIFPETLNPLTEDAIITYRIRGNAKIDVKIYNSRDQLVQTLVANKLHASGEYQIKWYGTVNGEQAGTPLPVGNYSYKILAKNPSDSSLEDSATGTMNVRYFVPTNNGNSDSDNDDAVVVVNNTPPKNTAQTGPGLLLYTLFPVLGYSLTRKK